MGCISHEATAKLHFLCCYITFSSTGAQFPAFYCRFINLAVARMLSGSVGERGANGGLQTRGSQRREEEERDSPQRCITRHHVPLVTPPSRQLHGDLMGHATIIFEKPAAGLFTFQPGCWDGHSQPEEAAVQALSLTQGATSQILSNEPAAVDSRQGGGLRRVRCGRGGNSVRFTRL